MLIRNNNRPMNGYRTIVLTDDIVHVTPVLRTEQNVNQRNIWSERITYIVEEATGWISWFNSGSISQAPTSIPVTEEQTLYTGRFANSGGDELNGVEHLNHSDASIDMYQYQDPVSNSTEYNSDDSEEPPGLIPAAHRSEDDTESDTDNETYFLNAPTLDHIWHIYQKYMGH